MNEKPPPDPADHAEDFSRRYARELEIASGQVMIDLGLSAYQMGARDPDRNSEHHTFFPGERSGGSISPAGQVTLDSAVMDPLALDGPYGGEAGALWRKSRLRDRMQAIIAHEMAEHEHDDHELALIAAPDTTLAIGRGARELLRRMENGWKWR